MSGITTTAAEANTNVRRGPLLDLHDRRLLAGAVVLAATAFALSATRFFTFHSSTFDLGVFEQAMWKLSHLRDPFVQMIGWNIFADHFSPVLVLFAPLYRLAASPLWFFAAQAVAFGLGLSALASLLDVVVVRDRKMKTAFLVCYALSPLLWNAVLFDFHPTTLVVPFAIVALNAALTNRWRALVVISICIVLLRDDLGLLVAAIALVGARDLDASGKRQRLALFVGGLAWVAFGSWMGRVLGADRNVTAHYGYIAASPTEALLNPFRSIYRAGQRLFRLDNLRLMGIFVGSVAALTLGRVSRVLLVILVLLPQLLSQDKLFHSSAYHYGAPVFALLILGSAEAAVRLPRRAVVSLAIVGLSIAAFSVYGPPGTRALKSVGFNTADAQNVVSHVRATDRVSASANLTPHLANRDVLLQFPYPFAAMKQPFPLNPSVTRVGPQAAAGIDAVAVTWRTPDAAAEIDRLLASYGFHATIRLGSAALYRR